MTDTTQLSTADLEAQAAALNAELAKRQEVADMKSHFEDEDGVPYTDPVAKNDALLRAMGVAMEQRVKDLDWQGKSVNDLTPGLQAAFASQDYVGIALYAAALNAITVTAA